MSRVDLSNPSESASRLVVMGVAGCGKSSLAAALSERLQWPLIEGDEFHSPRSVALMQAGVALTDADRGEWLATLADTLREHGRDAVLTCSALKHRYRELLRAASPDLRFVFLDIAREDSLARATARADRHFFNPRLIDSQFDILERPDGEAGVLRLEATWPLPELCEAVVDWL